MTDEQKKVEDVKQETRQNWADESDGDEDEGKEIGAARESKPAEKKQMGTKSLEPPAPPKNIPPPIARERNEYGDFVVTKIEIPDLKPKEIAKEEEASEESEEEEDEEPVAQEEAKDEAPKQKAKALSKKEKKKLEDEEFERVMNELGVQ